MSLAHAAEAVRLMASRMLLIKRRTCSNAQNARDIDRDEMYEFFKNRFLGLGFDIDGPDFALDSEVPIDDRPRAPAMPGYRWVRGSDGKWKQVKQNTSGGG